MFLVLGSLALMMAQANVAPAGQAGASAPSEYASPEFAQTIVWLRRPSAMDMARAHPRRSQTTGVEGGATLGCVIGANGGFESCEVLSETADGYGFGRAALSLRKLFKAAPTTRDGVPVAGTRLRIPIRFILPR